MKSSSLPWFGSWIIVSESDATAKKSIERTKKIRIEKFSKYNRFFYLPWEKDDIYIIHISK